MLLTQVARLTILESSAGRINILPGVFVLQSPRQRKVDAFPSLMPNPEVGT